MDEEVKINSKKKKKKKTYRETIPSSLLFSPLSWKIKRRRRDNH